MRIACPSAAAFPPPGVSQNRLVLLTAVPWYVADSKRLTGHNHMERRRMESPVLLRSHTKTSA